MKRLWDRFRKWLIRKLGGFTEPQRMTPFPVANLTIAKQEIVTVYAGTRVDLWAGMKPEEIGTRLNLTARLLGAELLKNGCVQVQWTDDGHFGMRDYKLSAKAVRVVEVNDEWLQEIAGIQRK